MYTPLYYSHTLLRAPFVTLSVLFLLSILDAGIIINLLWIFFTLATVLLVSLLQESVYSFYASRHSHLSNSWDEKLELFKSGSEAVAEYFKYQCAGVALVKDNTSIIFSASFAAFPDSHLPEPNFDSYEYVEHSLSVQSCIHLSQFRLLRLNIINALVTGRGKMDRWQAQYQWICNDACITDQSILGKCRSYTHEILESYLFDFVTHEQRNLFKDIKINLFRNEVATS